MTQLKSIRIWLLLAASMATAWPQAPQFTITTVAGNGSAGYSGDGGPATNAELNGPRGVTEDLFGNLYIAEFYGQRVRKVTPGGTITTFAGNGIQGFSGDGGPATSAELNGPYRVTVDLAGNVYIPDSSNCRIRKVSPDGTITTIAGNGFQGYSGDGGPATSASLTYPEAVAFDSAGNYYIADEGANVVRKVNPSGTITTAAGTGVSGYSGDGGPATSATLDGPVGVQVDSSDDLYISDQGNDVIRKVTSGAISTIAGNGVFGFAGDGGPAINAEFGYPASIGLDASGNLYIPDVNNNRIRVVLTTGTIWTVAGDGTEGYGGDGGPAVDAAINVPRSVSVAPNGNVYIGDFGNNRVRMLSQVLPANTPTISNGGVVGATDFGEFTSLAPGSWIEIYGTNLATATRPWSGSDFNGNNAPTSLNGTQVTINGQPAFVAYISPQQVNVQAPSNIAAGVQLLTVKSPGGASLAYQVVMNPVEPGLLAPSNFNINGTQYVVAFDDNTYVLPTGAISGLNSQPAKPGDTITLYGVGFGPVTPNVPAGQIAQGLTSLPSFNISIGGAPATVQYAGLAPDFVGLYQFNVVVPSIDGANPAPVTFSVNGTPGTQKLYLAVN
ncbi:MAG TPA: hypothetical protein VN924_10870 [Bryobacteraceae bacterium]|nr:hypothetical protein [Bryobacteraceae bacterium]